MSNGVRRRRAILAAGRARLAGVSASATEGHSMAGRATRGLTRSIPHDRGMRSTSGAVQLGWYRGQQQGVYDSYKKLRRLYPEAAAYLLKQFGMNKKGNIEL